MIVKIKRINSFEYSFADCDDKGKRLVCEALTFDNPDPYAYSDKIEMFSRTRFTFRIGVIDAVRYLCEKRKVDCQVDDYKFEMPDIEIDDRLGGKFIHQRHAVEAFFKRRFGIIVVPTRGGKTFIASEILRIFLQTDSGDFLFIVDNTTLFQQAINDITKFFERYGGISIGEIRSGRMDLDKRVTVAMIQTIQSALSKRSDAKKRAKMAKYLKNIKFLCVDEIHDNCSDSRLRVYKRCTALAYQLCLSATPYRSNAYRQNLKLRAWSGDIAYIIKDSELRDRKVLTDYRVFMLYGKMPEKALRGVNTYTEYCQTVIYENEQRNEILTQIIQWCLERKFKTLVLFQSIEHGNRVARQSGCCFVSGVTSSEEREAVKQAFLDEDGGVLLASNIFKKGVTLPQVQILINVDGGFEDANTIQRKGRVLGATEDKTRSVVVDFFDDAPYLDIHSVTRYNAYADDIGEEAISVIDTGKDWRNALIEGIENWLK